MTYCSGFAQRTCESVNLRDKTVQRPKGGRAFAQNSDGSLKFQQVYFVLDTEFRLLWIGGEWDEFALSNAGEAARSNEVLATSLLDHIADEETRRITRTIVETVVEMQEAFRIDYRCDSPSMLRRFHMTVQPMKDSRVLVVHDLRDAQSFPAPLKVWVHTPEAEDQKCTFCHAVRPAGQEWITADDLGEAHPARVAFTVCASCNGLVEEALAALRARKKPTGALTAGFGPKAERS